MLRQSPASHSRDPCGDRSASAMKTHALIGSLALALGVGSTLLPVAQDADLEIIAVAGPVSMLVGPGGNIGVSAGPDGMLMIDDKFERTAPKIRAALKKLGQGELELLLNTHYHGDHTGSNAAFGQEALILAHDNVRVRLLQPGRSGPMPAAGLPVVTFADSVAIHFNGEEIRVFHTPSAHTDGDSVVWFTGSNVVHMGDNFFAGRFPYVDIDGGGSVQGLIAATEKVLSLVGDDTKIIPGHGPLSTRSDLEATLRMLRETSARVQGALAEGKTLEQVKEMGVPEAWKGWGSQFIDEGRWSEILYRSLSSG